MSRFDSAQQFTILSELCNHLSFGFKSWPAREDLKLKLFSKYGHLAPAVEASLVNPTLIEETKHWLGGFPSALKLYKEGLKKYGAGVFQRNVLDDLRLSLETLLKRISGSGQSLENKLNFVGDFIKARGGSKQLANMYQKLLEYYAKYQNEYVKHDDAVIEEEIEFMFEITSSFLKHLVRLNAQQ